MAETPIQRLQRIQGLDTVNNQTYTSPIERLQQIQIGRENYISPIERLQQIQYGYPESSLNMEDEEFYSNLAMGDKELKEQQGVGFFKSLLHGISSAASLGYDEYFGLQKPDDKAMTTSEHVAGIVGEVGGGLVPFGIASAIIGSVGVPIAAGGTVMLGAYKALSKIGKINKQISRILPKLKKLEQQKEILGEGFKTLGGSKQVKSIQKAVQKLENAKLDNINIVREAQRQYTKELATKNTAASLRELKKISKISEKTALGVTLPRPAGAILPKMPLFNSMVKKVAENYGYKGAQVLNKFANNIGTFSAVGLASYRPGEDFGDRLKTTPKDVLMGGLFAAAGLPGMYGKAGATIVEPLAIMGLGSYSDYILGQPNPNMSVKERIIHGLSLVAFHEVGQRSTNWGAKEKMYKGLLDMGWNPEVAIKTIWGSNASDMIIAKARDIHQKRGTLMFNKNNPSDVIAIIGSTGAEKPKETIKKTRSKQRQKEMTEEKQATISYRNLITGELFTVEGKTMVEAAKKINKDYAKVDFKNKDLIDDLPPEVRKNADAFNENLKTDFKILDDISISRDGVETKGKNIQKYKSTEEIVFTDKGFVPNEQTKISDKKIKYKKDQIRALENIKKKVRTYDIDKLKDTDAPRKGYLVRWVKDNVEQLVRKDDGEPTVVRIEKIEGDYAYFKPDPNVVNKQKQNRIPLSELVVANKPFPKPRYRLRLLQSKDETSKRLRHKDKNWSDPQELIFLSEKEAREYAEKHWVKGTEDGTSNKSIDHKIERLQSEIDSVVKTTEYKDWEISNSKWNKAAKDYGLSENEKRVLIQLIHPKSIGDIKELSIREVNRLVDTIRGDEHATESVYHNRMTLPPENFITKIFPKTARWIRVLDNSSDRTKDWAKRVFLPTESILASLKGGAKAAISMLRHGWWRQSVVGTAVGFHKNLHAKLKPYLGRNAIGEVDKHIQAFLDTEVYGVLQNTPRYQKFADKMNSFKLEVFNKKTGEMEKITGLEYAKRAYYDFYDEMAKALISSNSWIRDASNKSFKRKPFMELYDQITGERIELVDMHKNKMHNITKVIRVPEGENEYGPILKTKTERIEVSSAELHEMQVESFLEYAKGLSSKVIDSKGLEVFVNKTNSKHFYVENYSRRQVTNEFFDLISSGNNNLLEAANYMAKHDKQFKDMKVPLEKKRDRAVEYIKMLQKINGQENISGQQYTRVADLPAYFYISRAPGNIGEIIKLRKGKEFKENGEAYKEGEIIYDEFGNTRKVEEVVPVYETDYSKVIDRYGTNIAHSTATYHAYPGKNTQGRIDALSSYVESQTGDKWYGDFTQKMLHSQVFGEKSSLIDKGLRVVSSVAAKTGLSFPMSGLKNALLGNRETISVFTGRELWKAYFSKDNGLLNPAGGFSRKWKSELEYARDIGATHTGAYELYLSPSRPSGFMKRFINNAGLMVTSEIGNRTISQAVGSHALDIHIANLANWKHPSTRKINPETSRRILMDVLRFTPDEISSMVGRYKSARKYGSPMNFSTSETNKARQQAHIVTQGSGDLPYMPLWLGTGWAKPLSLFYRVAYRMTDSVAKNIVKPVYVNGNIIPALKYIPLSIASGWAQYQMYNWAFNEDRVNKFKSMPSHMFDYFLKAEGLSLFSNAFNDFGGPFESYYPVPVRQAETALDNIVAYATDKKTGEQALGDGLRKIVAAYNGWERVIKARTDKTTKKVKDSKRRQRQFDDAFYPKEKINIDFDDGITTKTPYYRALRDVFWDSDEDTRGMSYYAALAWARDRIAEEKGISSALAEKEARSRLKGILSRMRPIPASWRKTAGRTGKSKYNEYLGKLNEVDREQEKMLEDLYIQKLQEFYQIIHKYKNKHYKEG